ncbi:MAG: hypothetical protein NVS9B14_22250 [Candidatus Acidiferrum sp.]
MRAAPLVERDGNCCETDAADGAGESDVRDLRAAELYCERLREKGGSGKGLGWSLLRDDWNYDDERQNNGDVRSCETHAASTL